METEDGTVLSYKGNPQSKMGRLFLCSLGFATFEWLVIQIFRDNIGYSNLGAWGMGLGIYLLYLALAVKYRRDVVDSLFV